MAPIVLSSMSMSCTLLAKKAEFSMFYSGHSRRVSKSKSLTYFKLKVGLRDLLLLANLNEPYLLFLFMSTAWPVNSRTYFVEDL